MVSPSGDKAGVPLAVKRRTRARISCFTASFVRAIGLTARRSAVCMVAFPLLPLMKSFGKGAPSCE